VVWSIHICKVINDVLCEIRKGPHTKVLVKHVDKLLPVLGPHDGSWVVKIMKPTCGAPMEEVLADIQGLFIPPQQVEGEIREKEQDGLAQRLLDPEKGEQLIGDDQSEGVTQEWEPKDPPRRKDQQRAAKVGARAAKGKALRIQKRHT